MFVAYKYANEVPKHKVYRKKKLSLTTQFLRVTYSMSVCFNKRKN